MARMWKGDLMQLYLDYTQNQESPDMFHAWSWISVMSATLGRNIWLNRGFYQIYPNHYIILLAASAECRKSVAVDIARELLEKAKVVSVSAERITNADLLRQLHNISKETGNSEMLIWADELKTFLTTEDTHKGVITTLTRLFTCPTTFENRTKTAGVDFLVNTCVNILAATTPTDFAEIIPGAATGSGFVPRLHIIFQEFPREKVGWPSKDPEMERILVNDLMHIRKEMHGEMVLSPKAKDWWDRWYEKEFKFPPDGVLNGFYGRKHDYVIKLGMVLAAGKKDELVVEKEDLTTALALLDNMEANMVRAYELLGSVPTLKYADAVLKQIKNAKGHTLKKSQIYQKNWRRMDAEDLGKVLQYLEESRKIFSTPLAKRGAGVKYTLIEQEEEEE